MTRFLLGFAAFTAAVLVLATWAHAAPCFDSLEAARVRYPLPAHISWQGPKTHFQYFKGYKGQHVKCDDAHDTVSVLDRPRSRSHPPLDTPKVAGAGRISPPPVTTGMNIAAPAPESPPPVVIDWKPVPVKTEPVKWPDVSVFAGPTTAPPAKTGARVKAVPQKDDPTSLAMAFGAPASMALGLSLIVWGWRMKP